MRLPENLREKLKIPLGKLIHDTNVSKETVLMNIPTGSCIITVGDATTEKMLKFGIIPSLQIIDSVEKRKERLPPSDSKIETHLSCDNPAGEITPQSISEIKKAFQSKPPVRISVNGEEDLLVLPVCIFAPENSTVLYGQPNEGLVVVPITTEIRNKAQTILDSMS